jgi:Na+/melibiose symporter-like transporter
MADATPDELTPGIRRSYAMGGLSSGTFATVPGLLLLPYLTDRIGVAAGLAGLIVFVPKAWDFVLNPIAGRISDRSTSPKGRRRPFVLWGGLALALAFVALFSGPEAPQPLAVAWVLIAFIAGATAYSFFQVPFIAMAAEMTTSYAERTRLMTWRVIILSLAILLAGGTAPLIVDLVPGSTGYRLMGLAMALLIAAGALVCWWGTRHAPLARPELSAPGLRDQLRIVASDKQARHLIATFFLQAVATSMVLAGVVYAAAHLVGGAGTATLLFVATIAPALLVSPLWERFGLARGKKRGYLASSLFLGGGMLALFGSRSGLLWTALLACAVIGIGYAGCQLFPLAMLPDVAAEDAKRSGENRIGLYTGVWAGTELLGFALGPALFAAVLAAGGYVSCSGCDVAQPGSAKLAMAVGVAVIPGVLVALSLLALRGYRLDDQLRADEQRV